MNASPPLIQLPLLAYFSHRGLFARRTEDFLPRGFLGNVTVGVETSRSIVSRCSLFHLDVWAVHRSHRTIIQPETQTKHVFLSCFLVPDHQDEETLPRG